MTKFIVGLLTLAFMPVVGTIGFLCPIIGACFYYGWDSAERAILNWDNKLIGPTDETPNG